MDEQEIQTFWAEHPCGDSLVGGFDRERDSYEAFFSRYDRFRYEKEAHILPTLDRIRLAGKHLLEIGLGQGADSEQLIRRGAAWSGVDLTAASVERVRTRLALRGLPYISLRQGSVLQLPFESSSFDIVFSHGVLHHVPDVLTAQREIRRVLRADGELIVMLYAKWSLNYLASIAIVRRIGLLGLYALGLKPGGIYGQHLTNAREIGLLRYLRLRNFIHRNTDGPLNPYSRLYDLRGVRRDFPNFVITKAYKQFMHAPPLPVEWLPMGRMLGWHLWVHMRPI